jgi:hypothetical protein
MAGKLAFWLMKCCYCLLTLTALGYEEAPSQKLLPQRTGGCHASLKVVICFANSQQHRAKSKCVLYTRWSSLLLPCNMTLGRMKLEGSCIYSHGSTDERRKGEGTLKLSEKINCCLRVPNVAIICMQLKRSLRCFKMLRHDGPHIYRDL